MSTSHYNCSCHVSTSHYNCSTSWLVLAGAACMLPIIKMHRRHIRCLTLLCVCVWTARAVLWLGVLFLSSSTQKSQDRTPLWAAWFRLSGTEGVEGLLATSSSVRDSVSERERCEQWNNDVERGCSALVSLMAVPRTQSVTKTHTHTHVCVLVHALACEHVHVRTHVSMCMCMCMCAHM